MTTHEHAPVDAAQLVEVLRGALAGATPLAIGSGGGLGALGRPLDAAVRLDVAALHGVVAYEPEELVLTARAATPLAAIETLLASRGQCLAFEPPDLGPLLCGTAPSVTLGAVVATGLSGPRRFKAGAVRDHVLGVRAVSGRGESFVCGGKVVKNVTGYDLPKLLTGSYGTLAVLCEVTLKVVPAPATNPTMLVAGLAPEAAVELITRALACSAEVSGACHLPPDVAAGLWLPADAAPAGVALTALRLEGSAPSVAARAAMLRPLLPTAGVTELVDADARALWRGVGAVTPFVGVAGVVWRLSVPPARGGELLQRLTAALPGARGYLDWAGGLVWLLVPETADAHAIAVRAAVAATGGHAMLLRAPPELRRATPVFQPPGPVERRLVERIKRQFDPAGILNPGRMYAGV